MDEGLVVISAVEKSITFASAPAVRLLKQQPHIGSQEDFDEGSISTETIDR